MFSLSTSSSPDSSASTACAILNEERFLAKIGWSYEGLRDQPPTVKKQIVGLLHAVRLVFTIPLMVLNVIVIALKLVLG